MRATPSDSRVLLPALAELPGHLVWRAHGRVTLALAEVLPAGVDVQAYAVLLALAGGRTRSQQALADTVSVSRTTMARVAADLEGAGLVERVRDPDDRRRYALTRTTSGAAAVRRWRRHVDAVEDAVTAGSTPAERDELHRLLLAVVDAELAPDAPEELRSSVPFLLSRIHFRMHRDFQAALDPIGLEPRLFGALTALHSTGPVAQADLARALGTSGPSVVQIADALESRGLVERRLDPADRRTRLLHLRPGAADVLAQARELAGATVAHRLGPLTPAETRELVRLLRALVTAP